MKATLVSIIIGIVAVAVYQDENGKSDLSSDNPVILPNNSRGYDFEKGNGYIQSHLSDDEIRDLRINNPSYIIKVEGRIIKSRKELTEDMIEDYIDEHKDEILEEHRYE